MLQHKLTSIYCSKSLQNQKQFNQMVHFMNAERQRNVCMYVCGRPKKAGKWSDVCAQQPITVMNEQTGFLPVLTQCHKFQEIKQNWAIFVWMKKNKDFIKMRKKQSIR